MIITDDMVNVARSSWLERASDYTMLEVSIRAALEAALAAIPLDEVTVERCVTAVWALDGEPCCNPEDYASDAWYACVEHAVAAIKKLPVVQPRPLPTLESVARAICCPDGCVREPLGDCRWEYSEDEATAVLALFGKGTS